jgi:hypothetical protein
MRCASLVARTTKGYQAMDVELKTQNAELTGRLRGMSHCVARRQRVTAVIRMKSGATA